MAAHDREPDDRIIAYTRGLSLFIAPFLLVAWVVLYLLPARTQQLWAWTIHPTMTAMLLASAYLGGFAFFLQVPRERRWAAVRIGFSAVAVFATLLGVATVIHWDRFNHHHVAFWLWSFLYFTAPFLVVAALLANSRFSAPGRADEPRLAPVARFAIGLVGALALATGLTMFLAPGLVIPAWPWQLTPLTCRVVGAVFCLGSAGLGVFADPRWIAARLLLRVETFMVSLIMVAAVRARTEFHTDRPLTWLMLGGFVAVLAGSAALLLGDRRAKLIEGHAD